jgi:pyridoxal phosphate enzyme (YggS family)
VTGVASVEDALAVVRSRIHEACRRSGRASRDVTLVAISKTVPVALVRRAWEAGVEDFGENYAAELADKAPQVPATWHFVGKLQTGTGRHVADHADVIHSAVPGPALQRVAHRAAARGKVVPCLVQVDFTGKRQGIGPEDVAGFIEEADDLSGIRVTGLMTLPPWTGGQDATRAYFRRLRQLRDSLQKAWPDVRELSMGMSGDYEVAVEEGATMLRVGTALFGERPAALG